jgi:hypothetical protein
MLTVVTAPSPCAPPHASSCGQCGPRSDVAQGVPAERVTSRSASAIPAVIAAVIAAEMNSEVKQR